MSDDDDILDPHAALELLAKVLDDSGTRVTFSAYCRSGIVGKLCRCWRCAGDDGPSPERDRVAKRDARRIDAARLRRSMKG